MKLQRPKQGSYELAEEGNTRAVLVDVVDMGMLPDVFAEEGELVHKLQLKFQTEDETSEGKPFLVATYPLKASLDSRANLYKIIKVLIGRDLETEDYDAEGDIDIDSLIIGQNCNVEIEHKSKGEKTYANVVSVNPLSKGDKKLEPLVPRDYVRVKDRDDTPEHTGE